MPVPTDSFLDKLTKIQLFELVSAILSKPGDLTKLDIDELNSVNEEFKRRGTFDH
jgi:hypothetical protein